MTVAAIAADPRIRKDHAADRHGCRPDELKPDPDPQSPLGSVEEQTGPDRRNERLVNLAGAQGALIGCAQARPEEDGKQSYRLDSHRAP